MHPTEEQITEEQNQPTEIDWDKLSQDANQDFQEGKPGNPTDIEEIIERGKEQAQKLGLVPKTPDPETT